MLVLTFLENLGLSSVNLRSLGWKVLILALTWQKTGQQGIRGKPDSSFILYFLLQGKFLTYRVKNNLQLQSNAPLRQPTQVLFFQGVGDGLSITNLQDRKGIRCWTQPWMWPSVTLDYILSSLQCAGVLSLLHFNLDPECKKISPESAWQTLSEYREQRNGGFSKEVWRLVSILIKDGHHQNVVNISDGAARRNKQITYLSQSGP